MKKTTEVKLEGLEMASNESVDMNIPLQELFEECLNFISVSSFDM